MNSSPAMVFVPNQCAPTSGSLLNKTPVTKAVVGLAGAISLTPASELACGGCVAGASDAVTALSGNVVVTGGVLGGGATGVGATGVGATGVGATGVGATGVEGIGVGIDGVADALAELGFSSLCCHSRDFPPKPLPGSASSIAAYRSMMAFLHSSVSLTAGPGVTV